MKKLFSGVYNQRKVLVTGHTGFKGSWLAFWLKQMGADVVGYALEPNTKPNHYELLDLNIESITGDVRDQNKLMDVFQTIQPEIVFHLAAQPFVRYSYVNPIETYETNIIGTLKVFEACRKNGVKAIVNITSDKCYENNEWVWGYRENDPMGGYDPYSSSKGCAELLSASYRNSYFNLNDYGISHKTLLASCRAGNVIGGGDWGQDRLITDIVTSTSKGEKVRIRKPNAIRPWQHVLEPLSGYLLLGEKLLAGEKEFANAWNFGPADENTISVENAVNICKKFWNKIDYELKHENSFHEATLLKLDCSKAHTKLHWKNVWNSQTTFKKTMEWYKAFYEENRVKTAEDLHSFIQEAREKKIEWANR